MLAVTMLDWPRICRRAYSGQPEWTALNCWLLRPEHRHREYEAAVRRYAPSSWPLYVWVRWPRLNAPTSMWPLPLRSQNQTRHLRVGALAARMDTGATKGDELAEYAIRRDDGTRHIRSPGGFEQLCPASSGLTIRE